MVFSKPEGAGCSVPSAVRALLRARGFTKLLNTIDPVGRSHICLQYLPVSVSITCIYKNLIIPLYGCIQASLGSRPPPFRARFNYA